MLAIKPPEGIREAIMKKKNSQNSEHVQSAEHAQSSEICEMSKEVSVSAVSD